MLSVHVRNLLPTIVMLMRCMCMFTCLVGRCRFPRLKLWNASPRPGKNVAIQLLADGLHVEADLLQFFVRENLATVEDVGRLHHRLVNALVVEILKGNVLLYVREGQRRQG